ncbi:hypothetical protein ABL78_0630 [Leptomonas seymouri]|uniref:Uncharacterized protein n=1 Tax=Leptomonas seymouri TaxID=5684 RepID=A0A0N1PDR5_LEPSE|nr:hypothetical protein ABL78_0630 [Leptomonas seymouri]|eukprot:KPI90248.1 hypothetical protein ABL78_0630 [Leptomonas seymouri]
MDALDSPSLSKLLGDDDDHVSPSLEETEQVLHQPPVPHLVDKTEVSLLPTSFPVINVEDSEDFTRATNVFAEDSSVVLVTETLQLSAKDSALDAAAASEPVLLGEEASQDLLLAPPVVPPANSTSISANLLGTEDAIAVVVTGNETDDVAEADVKRGAAIQDKYSATSQWVETLSLPTAPSLTEDVNVAVDGASGNAARTRRAKRAREGEEAQQSSGGGTLRQRRAREKAAETELQTAFKHSQRALRKQAKSVNMKDVFSRSTTLPPPLPLSDVNANSASTFPASPLFADGSSNSLLTANGNAFSPLSSCFRFGTSVFSPVQAVSPTTLSGSSAWSSCVVGELTNQFLSNVKQQRRQKCEQFVSRELTQSQTLSQSRSFHPQPPGEDREEDTIPRQARPGDTAATTATTSGFSAPVDELVIGEEDDEAANWMPAEVSSPASLHGRRMMRDLNANDDVVLLGASFAGEEGHHTTSPSTAASDSHKNEDLAAQQEQVVQSLARKHEIWKLKQRQVKAQQQVELDERAKAKQQQKQLTTTSSLAGSSTSASHTRTTDAEADKEEAISTRSAATATAMASASSSATATCQSFLHTSQIKSPSAVTPRTRHRTNLSAEAISMIRRINSFDNTSAQRVVVFGTAASVKQSKEDNTQ